MAATVGCSSCFLPYRMAEEVKLGKKELELYVHIPFCARKCAYCDFLSFPMEKEGWKQYLEALKREIKSSAFLSGEYEVSSVFFGGGTPSYLPAEEIGTILEKLKSSFLFRSDAEISLEANPGTVTAEKLAVYRRAGIGRISFGCQSTDNRELLKLGRIHTFEEFLESWQLARQEGFTNLNVDLMSGLPGQSVSSWESSLRTIAKLGPEHISAYSLILEEGTPFFEKQELLELPDEENERQMYERTCEILAEYGYHQYEISNYAKDGYECRHNLGYWTGTEYLGLGLGASSLLNHIRYRNTEDFGLYCRQSGQTEQIREVVERLDEKDRQAEFMILGLRLTRGISVYEFEERFGIPLRQVYAEPIERYLRQGLLYEKEGRIALTRRGISLSNTVLADFL